MDGEGECVRTEGYFLVTFVIVRLPKGAKSWCNKRYLMPPIAVDGIDPKGYAIILTFGYRFQPPLTIRSFRTTVT